MQRLLTISVLIFAAIITTGCQTWHSPYRGTQWRMDQVMDGDPFREGDGNHAAMYVRR